MNWIAKKRNWLVSLLTVTTAGCEGLAVAKPFDRIQTREIPAEYTVVVTETSYNPAWSSRRKFWSQVRELEATLANSPGLLGYSLRRDLLTNRAWTMTVWADPTDVKRFVTSRPHAEAMAQAGELLRGARFTRFTASGDRFPPTWNQALSKLDEQDQSYTRQYSHRATASARPFRKP